MLVVRRYVTLHSQWNRKIGCIHVAVAALPGASTSLTDTYCIVGPVIQWDRKGMFHAAVGFPESSSEDEVANLITDILKISNQPLSKLVLFIERLIKIYLQLLTGVPSQVVIRRIGNVLQH